MNPYHRPLETFIIIFGIITVMSLIAIIKPVLNKNKSFDKRTYKNPVFIIGIFMFVLGVSNITAGFINMQLAIKHGAGYELNIMKTPFSLLVKHNKKSENATLIKPKKHENTVNIVYKYADKTCERIFKDLKTELEKSGIPKSDIYFVPSNSDYGKELTALTNIYEIPVAVYSSPTEISAETGKYAMKNIVKYVNRYPKLNKTELNNILLMYRK